MKIAIAQLDAGIMAREDRKKAISASVRDAAAIGCRIVVLPELALTGYGAGPDISATAEDIKGADAAWLQSVATQSNCAVAGGLALKKGDAVFNSALFATPDGRSVAYDKIHLYGDYERSLFAHGTSGSPVFDFEGSKFGLLVCFDVEFPERVRDLALKGAQAVLVPTALPQSAGGAFIAQSVVPVRAFENQVFVAYANHAGTDARFTFQGQSCIAAPDGNLLAQASAENASLITADINPDAYEACRVQNPYLAEIQRFQGALGSHE